mgnify:CR=1 FL=1
MKLSDIKLGVEFPNTYLFTGATGSGKTDAIGSFPGKIYIHDFDCRLGTLAARYPHRGDDIEYDSYPTHRMLDFKSKVEGLVKDCPYDVVCFDSLTFLARNAVNHMIRSRSREGKVLGGWRVSDIEDYGGETSVIVSLLDAVQRLRNQGKTVIVTAHLLPSEDATMPARVVTGGKSIAPMIPGAFDNVFYFYIDKDLEGNMIYKVRTRSSDKFAARTIFTKLPNVIDVSEKGLYSMIKEITSKEK